MIDLVLEMVIIFGTVFISAHHFGGGLWAYMGGFIFDRTGSYRVAFALSALMALIALICCIFLKEKRHRLIEDTVKSDHSSVNSNQ